MKHFCEVFKFVISPWVEYTTCGKQFPHLIVYRTVWKAPLGWGSVLCTLQRGCPGVLAETRVRAETAKPGDSEPRGSALGRPFAVHGLVAFMGTFSAPRVPRLWSEDDNRSYPISLLGWLNTVGQCFCRVSSMQPCANKLKWFFGDVVLPMTCPLFLPFLSVSLLFVCLLALVTTNNKSLDSFYVPMDWSGDGRNTYTAKPAGRFTVWWLSLMVFKQHGWN